MNAASAPVPKCDLCPAPATRIVGDIGGTLACDEHAKAQVAEPTALAWTPDDEIERGAREFKRLWPKEWKAWLRWCKSTD